jgi:hypothetical protein
MSQPSKKVSGSEAEDHFSRRHNVYASAGASWIYMIPPRSCEEIVTEYQEVMTDLGWTTGPAGNCDKEIWLRMVNSDAGFSMYGEPPEAFLSAEEWWLLQEQYEDEGLLYYVIVNVIVDL